VRFPDAPLAGVERPADANVTNVVPAGESDDPATLANPLLDSDIRYFEIGACLVAAPSARLALFEGLENHPVGCVGLRVRAEEIRDPETWLDGMESAFRDVGAQFRIYLTRRAPHLESALRCRGKVSCEEIGYVAVEPPAGVPQVRLQPICTAADWAARRRIYEAVPPEPAVGLPSAAAWMSFEHRKCELGYMEPYLVTWNDEVCGSVSAAPAGPLLSHEEPRCSSELEATRDCHSSGGGADRIGSPAGPYGHGPHGRQWWQRTACLSANASRARVSSVGMDDRELVMAAYEAPRDDTGHWALTVDQRDQYWRDGYVVLRQRFRSADVEQWRREAERIWATPGLIANGGPRLGTRKRVDGGMVVERIDGVAGLSSVFAALAVDPRISVAVGDALGDGALLLKDKLIVRPDGALGYDLHQDYPYWSHMDVPADAVLSVLLPIDPFDPGNGSLELFPALHGQRLPGPAGDPLDTDPAAVAGRPSETMTLMPGDALIFHSLVPHRSGPNTSGKTRCGLFLTYNAAAYGDLYNAYLERLDAQPTIAAH